MSIIEHQCQHCDNVASFFLTNPPKAIFVCGDCLIERYPDDEPAACINDVAEE